MGVVYKAEDTRLTPRRPVGSKHVLTKLANYLVQVRLRRTSKTESHTKLSVVTRFS